MNGRRAIALAALLGSGIILSWTALAQTQQPLPNAPTPQPPPSLGRMNGPITPGIGATGTPSGPNSSSGTGQAQPDQPPAPSSQPPVDQAATKAPAANPQDANTQATPPETGNSALASFVVQVNFVQVPVTVKDSKGNLIAGLDWRDFKVYENNTLEPIRVFSVDPQPLSIAFVIDQTLPSNVMAQVNQSLGAFQGALAPYDEAAVFTYTNGAKEWTSFTGAESNRLPAVLSLAQNAGTDPMVPINSGPMAGCGIYQNGNCASPVLQPGGSTGDQSFIKIPKEIHTLNDAILQAAKELSTRPKDRRRIIYVVSDGKEYGSRANEKEVMKYLETNKIAVFGTLVGDSARWGEGWLDRFHLPFQMYGNILYKYVQDTGGDLYSELATNGMEKSYAKLTAEARNQYTLGYLSHASIYDEKFRQIDVRVDRPNVVVTAKRGYYSSAQDYK